MRLSGHDGVGGECEALRTELELTIIRAGVIGTDFDCILDAVDALVATAIQDVLGGPEGSPFSSA